MKISRFIALLLVSLVSVTAFADVTLIEDSRAKSRIILPECNQVNLKAAHTLNFFLEKMTGDTLRVSCGKKAKTGDIIIGESDKNLQNDAYRIKTQGDKLIIYTGGGKGAIYGITTLLERYLGVNYWAKNQYDYPRTENIILPEIELTDTPAFRYRQSYSYGIDDPIYYDWYRLNMPDEVFAGNLWVHTFNKLLPASVYGKEHPEWYAMNEKGQRVIGDYSQWCLSNDEVFEAACEKIDSVFKAHPDMNLISISQNDRDESACQCPECKKIYEEEGAYSGALIRFLNRIAERFPDKEFSTLAYQYSMNAPLKVVPRKNVVVMLCNIECMREKPLTQTPSGQNFVKALHAWHKLSDNIYMWDYGINFSDLISMFPGFHVLAPNLQLFKENGVTMVHEQVNGHKGVDMSEMRAYVLGKLMWNPYQDVDSLVSHFISGYYGKAAPYIQAYHNIRQKALADSGKRLWIYDTPLSHKDGMLNAGYRAQYNYLFDKALAAVKDDIELTNRVYTARLPLIYSELEIARADGTIPDVEQKLELFDSLCRVLNAPMLKENNYQINSYVNTYRDRYLNKAANNLARGAKITWINAPLERYMPVEKASAAMTDGRFGGYDFNDGWAGWVGSDPEMIIDLGSMKTFRTLRADFLHQIGSWILWPKSGTFSVSTDGKNFTPVGTFDIAEDRDNAVKFTWGTVDLASPMQARYVKLKVDNFGKLPEWHLGAGQPSCLFIDEVEVLE